MKKIDEIQSLKIPLSMKYVSYDFDRVHRSSILDFKILHHY